MERRLFNILSALSLLLCVAVAALWMRSYWVDDTFWYAQPDWGLLIETENGEFRLEHTTPSPCWIADDGMHSYVYKELGFQHYTDRTHRDWVLPERIPGDSVYFWNYGFGLVTGDRWEDYHHALFLPGWFLLAVFVSLPAIRLVRWARERQLRRPGLCLICGYDLRASKDRCPECGTPVIAPLGHS